MRQRQQRGWVLGFILALLVVHCGPPGPADSPAPAQEAAGQGVADQGAIAVGQLARGELPSPVPIEADDAVWGTPNAPVTLVVFLDLQCPFCAQGHKTLEALRQRYGPDQLRIVIKHLPLDFHEHAVPAAVAMQAVRELAGGETAVHYAGRVLEEQHDLSESHLVELASEFDIDENQLSARLSERRLLAAIDHDMRLAAELGINGTPSFLVNGRLLVGALPPSEFIEAIDAELKAVASLKNTGVAPQEVYALRVQANLKATPDSDVDTTTYYVPISDSPTLGPSDALVTIVEFSEFQCPFCRRVRPTLEQLMARFPKDVRLVFKHLPLGFHEHALPAARLSAEIFRTQGNEQFWHAADALFAGSLDDQHLRSVAKNAGLNGAQIEAALDGEAGQTIVDRDLNLSEDLGARGTPHFFINGKRLAGAQPYEEFEKRVLEAIVNAREVLKGGEVTPAGYYAELMRQADPLFAPKRVTESVPASGRPSWGPEGAPVVLHAFSDFQCGFCARAEPTLGDLRTLYPKQLRVVWHNLPLPFHEQARPAAIAALEAYAQQGDAGFQKMHDLLFSTHGAEGGPDLSEGTLLAYAKQLGLDESRFKAALIDGRHDAALAADVELAKQLGIDGTPGFVVGSWLTTGARPLRYLRALVDRTLREKPGEHQGSG